MGSLRNSKGLLRRESFPGMGQYSRTKRGGNLQRIVSGAGIDHQNLISAVERANGAGDVGGFILRDDGGGNGRHRKASDKIRARHSKPWSCPADCLRQRSWKFATEQ